MEVKEAINFAIGCMEGMEIGKGKVNYRLRDAIFSRQRYWGEPFPVYYKNGIPYTLDESEIPLELPPVDAYLPTEAGDPPLARAKNWKTKEGYPLETNTMPGFAGSSGYYLRYMDPKNDKEYFSKESNAYWENVDLYIGGAEHATGHLIYSRFWNKFLYDLGLTVKDEPFQKMINQGMIQGVSMFSRIINNKISDTDEIETLLISKTFNQFFPTELSDRIPAEFVDFQSGNYMLTSESLNKIKEIYPKYKNYRIAKTADIRIIWEKNFPESKFNEEHLNNVFNDKVILDSQVEKMSKSKYNVINPDDLVVKYGADTLRLYEMFLGPLEMHKPWDTNGIEGVSRFMRKLWRLYHDTNNDFLVSEEEPTPDELRVIHRTIKKIQEDIERFSFNTAVSSFMICVNELTDLKCNKRKVLNDLTLLISPFAPHMAEELWSLLGNKGSITQVAFPQYNEKYISVSSHTYPVSFNGKMRFKLELPLDMPVPEIEKAVLSANESEKWLEGKQPKKVIVIQGKIINIVL
jgi:leucyl-tRNA synthetase